MDTINTANINLNMVSVTSKVIIVYLILPVQVAVHTAAEHYLSDFAGDVDVDVAGDANDEDADDD